MERRRVCSVWLAASAVSLAALAGGCFPTVQHGRGKTYYRECQAVKRNYYLYVPEHYNPERRYPLVVTLHGMKPYDSAPHHPRMWGQLADQHRFLVVAPVLQTSDTFGQFPLRSMNAAEKHDVQCILAIMDEVMSGWEVDPNAVLLSSWSMGGYLAHYIATEYGDRFAAFAPLQSNFSNRVLNASNARRFAGRLPVFIFYGTGDFAGVTSECKEAVEWYRRLGFDVRTRDMPVGHQRHPELAAEFFEGVLARTSSKVQIVTIPPAPGSAPLAVKLWPAISSKVGPVKMYSWDFGPTLGATYQKDPNVIIRHPGNYLVKLTVVETTGRVHTAEATLRVLPAASARGN